MATNALETQGTLLEIETGTGGAKTITGITQAAIAKVTSTAHGLAVGDVVEFASVGGMTTLNGTKHMVIAVETDDFYIDVDTTGYSSYTSGGTATSQTYMELAEILDFEGPGGSANVIDATHLRSTAREKLMGIPDNGQFSISVNWIPTDTGQAAVRTARTNRTKKGFRITYTDSPPSVQTFDGFVLQFSSAGGVDAKVDGSITIEITGDVALA